MFQDKETLQKQVVELTTLVSAYREIFVLLLSENKELKKQIQQK